MRKIDYSIGYAKALRENRQKVNEEIDTPDMKLKIENWAKKFGYSSDEVRDHIIASPMFADTFAKDPGKQSFHQHWAAKFISENENVVDFEELPAMGDKSMFISSGKVVYRPEVKEDKDTKSIDFKWTVHRDGVPLTFYAAHKYTAEGGGSQDNQYQDLKCFMRQAEQAHIPNVYFLAIADGDYYQHPSSRKSKYASRIEEMNSLYGSNPNCVALTCNDIDQFISDVLARKK